MHGARTVLYFHRPTSSLTTPICAPQPKEWMVCSMLNARTFHFRASFSTARQSQADIASHVIRRILNPRYVLVLL